MRSLWFKILGIITVLLIAAILSINFLLGRWLNSELESILNKDPNRKNNITFTDFSIKIAQGDIAIYGVKIIPINSDSSTVPIATINKFVIDGVNFRKLLTSKEIETKTLRIVQPVVTILIKARQKVIGDSKKINLLWKDILTRVNVKNFEIVDGLVSIYDPFEKKRQFSMNPVNLTVTDIIVDTTTIDDPFPLKYETIDLSAGNIEMEFTDFILKTESIWVSEHTLNIKGLNFIPLNENNRPQIITISTKSIDVSHFEWGFLNEEFFLSVNTIEVDQAHLSVLKNMRVAPSTNEKPLLPTILRELPMRLHVDSVVVKNSEIIYEHPNNEGTETGKVLFQNFYCTGYNITNVSEALKIKNTTTIDVETDFMETGHLKSQFNFDITDTNDGFNGFGNINGMDITEFNSILSPLVNIELSGEMSLFQFNIKGNKWSSEGKLTFDYKNLNVHVFDETKNKKKVFLSGLSKLVVNGNNAPDMAGYKTGTISASKIRNKSFFVYLWDSLKSGIMEIAAPNVKTEKKNKRKKKKK